ncbi:MAG: hypothetical protein AB1585_22120 [Thermodesulfobacteriota bacterium]
MILRKIFSQVTILNGLLIAGIAVFFFGFLSPRLNTDVTYAPTIIKKKPMGRSASETSTAQAPLSPQDYRTVADENLFHPDRIVPPEKKAEAALPKPEFVLYGTLLAPDLSLAYMEDKKAPVTTPGRGQRQTALKIGETLSGFRLKEVAKDRVVMVRGEESLQVLLQDPGTSKPREAGTGAAVRGSVSSPGRTPTSSPPLPNRTPPPLPPGQRVPVPERIPPPALPPPPMPPGR